MKQCVRVVEEEYDGELRFSITDCERTPVACILTLGAQDEDRYIGFKVEIPLVSRRLGFKTFQMIYPSAALKISSIGEKSDQLIQTLMRYYHPDYQIGDRFTDETVIIDYILCNTGSYDLNQDKIYLNIYYDEEQDEDLPPDERIHLNMNFSFNLSRESASLIETKEGYSADLIAFLVK